MGQDKYRFQVSYDSGTFYHTVTLVKPPIISGKLDEKIYRYARKSTSWKFVRHENQNVYDSLLDLIHAPSTAKHDILVRIQLYDTFSAFTSTEFTGYVPLNGIIVNENNGAMELSPDEKSDYEWYERHRGDKVDVYNRVNGMYERLNYTVTTVEEAYYIPLGDLYTTPTGFAGPFPTSTAFWATGTAYVNGYASNSWVKVGVQLYHCITSHTSNATNHPTGSLGSVYWEQIVSWTGGGIANKVDKYVRQISDLPFKVGGTEYIQGNGDYEVGFPLVLSTNSDYSRNNCEQYKWFNASEVTATGTMTLCGTTDIPDPGNTIQSDGPNHSLIHVIKRLWQIPYAEIASGEYDDPSGLTLTSTFLTSTTNPLTGGTNHYDNLRLVHNRAVKGIQDIETTGEMSIDDLMRDLCETLQLAWSIDGTTLRIEHISYYQNGRQYTGTKSVYTDLTNTTTYPLKWQTVYDIDGQASDNEYSFNAEGTAEKERFAFPDGYDTDGEIKYITKFCKRGEVLEHNITTFMSDFAYVLAYRVDSLDDSWCLIAAEPTVGTASVIRRRDAKFRWRQCPITVLGVSYSEYYERTESNYPNGDMIWCNLLPDLWSYNTFFQVGMINGNSTTVIFETYKKIKRQREIKFPRLAAGAFDPEKLITTNLGDGEVESFDINTDTDFIKVILIY